MTNFIPNHCFQLKIIFLSIVFASCSSDSGKTLALIEPAEPKQRNLFRIVVLGDSLTEGYGVSEQQAYPTLLETRLNQEFSLDRNTSFEVINAGISGATTSGGVSRIDWLLKSTPNFLVIALGGNDGLRGVPIVETQKNLENIILAAKAKSIPTLLAGMKIPPNYGIEYTRNFSKLYNDLARAHKVAFLPFLLEGVGGIASMNLPDRIHPNPAGHQKIAETVYQSLIPYLPQY